MRFNSPKFAAIVAAAKAAAANSPRWIRAVKKAAAAIIAGEIKVHIFDGFALVASKNGVYKVNGHCECKAAQAGHRECYHRAAARLVEMYESAPKNEGALTEANRQNRQKATAPTITRSIERDYRGNRHIVVRCNGWMI